MWERINEPRGLRCQTTGLQIVQQIPIIRELSPLPKLPTYTRLSRGRLRTPKRHSTGGVWQGDHWVLPAPSSRHDSVGGKEAMLIHVENVSSLEKYILSF